MVALIILVHGVSGWHGYAERDLTVWQAWFADRPTGFRIAVGGQHTARLVRGEAWRIATSVLLHVDALHLTMNALSLWALGRVLEPVLGAARFLAWFVLGGILGSLGSWFVGVLASDGASGGGFALLAAAAWLGLRHRTAWDPEDQRFMGPVLLAFLVLNLIAGCFIPGIDNVGHTSGLLAGLALAALDPVRDAPALRTAYGAGVAVFGVICLAAWGGLL